MNQTESLRNLSSCSISYHITQINHLFIFGTYEELLDTAGDGLCTSDHFFLTWKHLLLKTILALILKHNIS